MTRTHWPSGVRRAWSNAAVAEAAKTDLQTDWIFRQGERVMGAFLPLSARVAFQVF